MCSTRSELKSSIALIACDACLFPDSKTSVNAFRRLLFHVESNKIFDGFRKCVPSDVTCDTNLLIFRHIILHPSWNFRLEPPTEQKRNR